MCLRGTCACDQARVIGTVVSQGSQRGIVSGSSQPFLLLSHYYCIQSLNLNHVHGFYLLGGVKVSGENTTGLSRAVPASVAVPHQFLCPNCLVDTSNTATFPGKFSVQ